MAHFLGGVSIKFLASSVLIARESIVAIFRLDCPFAISIICVTHGVLVC